MISEGDEVKEREQFENQYYELVAEARSLLEAASSNLREGQDDSVTSHDSVKASGFNSNCIRLPKIELPTFSGHYQHWLEFRDTYISLIHSRSDIDNINKLRYLRASLKESAFLVVDTLDIKGDNYEQAWKLLCNKYDNKRLLVNNHVLALFKAEQMQGESCTSIRNLIDITNKNLRALTTLEEPTQYWDTLIIYIMSEKLDSITNRKWEEYRNNLTNSPTLDNFMSFLNNRADLLETLQEKNKGNINVQSTTCSCNTNFLLENQNLNTNGRNIVKNHTYKKPHKCSMCDQIHYLFNCDTFKSLSVENRIQKAKEAKVCLNCLRPGHAENKCLLSSCKYCKTKHNTLLHLHTLASNPEPTIPNFAGSTDINQCTTPRNVLLSTALVKVIDGSGAVHTARVLLDNGSTANFVTHSLCGRLGLFRRSASATVTGINNNTFSSTQSCSLTIMSYHCEYKVVVDCHIIPQISEALPSSFVNIKNMPLPIGITLADPSFNVPSSIDILVGAEVFWSVLCNNSINLGRGQPQLYETKLGWLISGYVARPQSETSSILCNFVNDPPDLTRFWELDSVAAKHSLSSEERACEQSFMKHTKRNDQGRFIVTMPLKQSPEVLGESFQRAKCRFLSLERKFEREPRFRDKYIEFMTEYERLGHMTENKQLSPNCRQEVSYFLPHHGVIRDSSSTTKLRTVFDASAASSSGISLNDIQMVGPTVQEDLYSILLRFRQHKYVITGDIEKMYRAIDLDPSQRSLVQIVFRANKGEPLKTYKLNTVTYGTASAPYLATKCLVSLASIPTLNSDVKQSIQRDFYVDDYLGGGSSIDKTINMCKGVISVLKSAQFNLRKFRSNNQNILNEICPLSSESDKILDLSVNMTNNSSKTLGLNWISDIDTLSFAINIQTQKKITKRHILSVISQIFDPLGLVTPCVVEAKIIMQRLWIDQCTWDDEVTKEIADSWSSFAGALSFLNQLKIPRWVETNASNTHEIHVFSDASESAYGACLYIRSLDVSGAVKVHLLTSKSRVAPIKPTTIPRLELCGALLAARLCAKVLTSLTISITKCRFWCDSTIVLGWLTTSSLQLKHFVRNRVHEIQEITEGHTWKYVASRDNPADLVSRGLKADAICNCALWWAGPMFLLKDESEWPKMPSDNGRQDLPELVVSCSVALSNSSFDSISAFINNRSNLIHVRNSLAYLQRFIHNCRYKKNKLTGPLSTEELQNSLNLVMSKAQLEMFPEEYAILKAGKNLSKSNRLISLSPFLDTSNIIRLGGRLEKSPYDYDVKHPIILCSKHHLTKILFHYYHIKHLHAGPQLLLAILRQTYWPLGGRNLSRLTVSKCVRCCRYKADTVQPIMAHLPSSRTELEFPFLHCSVDYAGPVLIADRKGRGCKIIKSFLAIFICNSTKACHIELVTALSSEAYIAALKRFVARRGKPLSITSDNGTNFVGASKELAELLVHADLGSRIAQESIEFKFVPPYSPHFNGLAEAAVRSIKFHLKRLLNSTHCTYEEMTTCLTQVEAVLNSRPLTPLSSDPSDFSALTPGHFLIGRPLTSIPHPKISTANINYLERFKRIEHMKQHFWQRFSLEYVTLLQQRMKWQSQGKDLKLGTLVLIKDKNLPPLLWSLGRVVKLHSGVDGVSRVAEIKTGRGVIRRAYNNICPLPDSV